MQVRHHRLRNGWPTLARAGIAVQWFDTFEARIDPATKSHFNTHDVLYMSFIVAGRACHDIGDKTFAEEAGSLSLVNYGVPHRISTPGEPVTVCNIYLDPQRHPLPSLPGELNRAVYAFLPLHEGLQHKRNRLLRVQFDDPALIGGQLQRMWQEQQSGAMGSELVLLAELQILLLHLGRALLASGWREPTDEDPLMAACCELLVDDLTVNPSLDDLAERYALSKHYLCRRFKRYTGLTVLGYLMQRRLQEACLRLRSSDDKILAIALDCGFNNVSYFNRQFKKALGISPGKYRARCRG